MKKFFAIFACTLLMLGAISSCGEKAEEDPANGDEQTQEQPAEENGDGGSETENAEEGNE